MSHHFTPELPDDLTDPEERLIAAAAKGKPCIFGEDGELPPQDTTPPDLTIRAEVIRFLALGGDKDHPVDPRGVWLEGAAVPDELNLQNATVPFNLFFVHCRFDAPLNLRDTHCQLLSFAGSYTPGLNADRLTTSANLFLSGKDHSFIANGQVRLSGAQIGGDLVCENAIFSYTDRYEGALFCERAVIKGTLFLREGTKVTGHLNLSGATIGTLCDDRAAWPKDGYLILDGCVYDRIAGPTTPTDAKGRLDWLALQPEDHLLYDFCPQPYEQLAKVFRQMGHTADAREVGIAKQLQLRKSRMTPPRRSTPQETKIYKLKNFHRFLWSKFLEATIGFGYKPWRVGWWLICFLIFGAVIFDHGNRHNLMVPADSRIYSSPKYKNNGKSPPVEYSTFNPFIYSLDTLIPLVALHQEKYWEPRAKGLRGTLVRIYLWLQIIAGWFLASIGAAGLTGIIKKD